MQKEKIDTSKWGCVNIIDLFDIKGGQALTKSNFGAPLYPYVGSSSSNNGITGLCSRYNYENILGINYDGSVGYCFLHKEKVFLSDRCRALIPKYKRTDNIDHFMCVVLTERMTKLYNYGKKLGTERLKKEHIFLPFKDGNIDFEFIESFMNECNKEVAKWKDEQAEMYKGADEKLDTSKWVKFNITDLFDAEKGSGIITKSGKYKLVSASNLNNGVAGLSNSFDYSNCFTFSSVGQPGFVSWHGYEFKTANNMGVLIPKFKCNRSIGAFISVVATKQLTPKYSYGKTLSLSRINKESIFLPEKDGEPDWEFMESYINSLIIK